MGRLLHEASLHGDCTEDVDDVLESGHILRECHGMRRLEGELHDLHIYLYSQLFSIGHGQDFLLL